jgi:hypothetical protein
VVGHTPLEVGILKRFSGRAWPGRCRPPAYSGSRNAISFQVGYRSKSWRVVNDRGRGSSTVCGAVIWHRSVDGFTRICDWEKPSDPRTAGNGVRSHRRRPLPDRHLRRHLARPRVAQAIDALRHGWPLKMIGGPVCRWRRCDSQSGRSSQMLISTRPAPPLSDQSLARPLRRLC